jgi:hypothetical protein
MVGACTHVVAQNSRAAGATTTPATPTAANNWCMGCAPCCTNMQQAQHMMGPGAPHLVVAAA